MFVKVKVVGGGSVRVGGVAATRTHTAHPVGCFRFGGKHIYKLPFQVKIINLKQPVVVVLPTIMLMNFVLF